MLTLVCEIRCNRVTVIIIIRQIDRQNWRAEFSKTSITNWTSNCCIIIAVRCLQNFYLVAHTHTHTHTHRNVQGSVSNKHRDLIAVTHHDGTPRTGQSRCVSASCFTRSMLLHGLAESPGADKQQAQNTLETVMAVQGGKTLTAKKMHFSQAPVSIWFCEHFLLFTALIVLTELKGTSSLPSSSGFMYSSCLFLSLFLRNYTDILTPVLLVNNTKWFRCYP